MVWQLWIAWGWCLVIAIVHQWTAHRAHGAARQASPAHWEPLGCGVVQIHRCVAAHRERPAVGAQAQQPGVGQRIGEPLGRLILADEKRLGHHDLLRRQCHVNAENEITTRCGDFIIQRDGKPHPDQRKPFAICHLMRWRQGLWKVGMR